MTDLIVDADHYRPKQWQRVLHVYQQLVIAHLGAQQRCDVARREFLRAIDSAQSSRALVVAERESREAAARARAELRAEVRATVQTLREHALPPERVLCLVREAMRETCASGTGPVRYEHDEVMRLSSDIGQWVIEDYFAGV